MIVYDSYSKPVPNKISFPFKMMKTKERRLSCVTGMYDPMCAQKITLEDLSESKSAIEDKSTRSNDRSHSVNSIRTTTHETTNVAVYEVRCIRHAKKKTVYFGCQTC